MGNRSFLYLTNADANEDEFEEIADANNLLPTLWHILLADGDSSPAIDYQRVFGDAQTANISSPALQALARFKRFAKYLKKHPRFDEMPALKRYLIAAETHLTQLISDYQSENGKEAILSASLDELSWLDDSPPEVFIAQCIADFNATWTRLEAMIESKDYDDLEEVLEFKDVWNLKFTDWNAWSTVFGLALFQHPYFDGTWEEPQTIDFADYDADDDEFNGDSYLGAGCYRFKENGFWGVKNEVTGEIISDAQWQKVRSESSDIYQVRVSDELRRCWVMQDNKMAMMAICGTQKGQLLTPFLFDDAWAFDDDGICIAKQQDKMGHLKRDGNWYLEPKWQEAWDFEYGLAIIAQDGISGYMDKTGKTIFEPQFDEAFCFNEEGTAIAKKGKIWSLLKQDGSVILSGCNSIEWSDDFSAWMVEQGVNRGLYKGNGEQWLPIVFNKIIAGRNKYITVKQNGQASLLDWSATQTVMPFEFVDIALFAKQKEARSEVDITHLVRVSNASSTYSVPSHGVWDITQQKLIVPCEYRHIWLVLLGVKNNYGFYVAKINDNARAKTMGKYSVQLLNSEGVAMFRQDFAWIASSTNIDQPNAMEKIREEIFMSWARGKPVAAKVDKSGTNVNLKPDGSIS